MCSLFSQPGLFVVTGTNRGFGKEIVIQLAQNAAHSSHFVLISKSSDVLNKSKVELREKFAQHRFDSHSCDLGLIGDVTSLSELIFQEYKDEVGVKLLSLVFVHNAGSIG